MEIKKVLLSLLFLTAVLAVGGPNNQRCLGYCKKINVDQNGGYNCSLGETGPPQCNPIGGDGLIRGDEQCDVGTNYIALPSLGSPCINGVIQEGFECEENVQPSICRKRFTLGEDDEGIFNITKGNFSIWGMLFENIAYGTGALQ